MKNLTEEQVGAIVKWLSDTIANPEGRDDDKSVIARIMKDNILSTQIDLFAKKLSTLISENGVTEIYCDYQPDGVLREAMEFAYIPLSRAPHKMHMWITDGKVIVENGVCAEKIVIFPVPT